jgi:hypothetical protein
MKCLLQAQVCCIVQCLHLTGSPPLRPLISFNLTSTITTIATPSSLATMDWAITRSVRVVRVALITNTLCQLSHTNIPHTLTRTHTHTHTHTRTLQTSEWHDTSLHHYCDATFRSCALLSLILDPHNTPPRRDPVVPGARQEVYVPAAG